MPRRRSFPIYLLFLFVVVTTGYASRRYGHYLPLIIRKRTGDALWASAIFVLLAIIRPRASTIALGVVTLLISFAVEFSQLYHAEWIDTIRRTTLGSIALGSTFFKRDLIAYTIGVAAAALIDFGIRRSSLK